MCKILVVDDSKDVRDTLGGELIDRGYDVVTVGSEGETHQKVIQESFDYAIVDVRLHDDGEYDESGISLALALRALAPRIRIILLSRYVEAEQILRATRYHGIVDYVDKTKQSWIDTVLRALEEVKSESQQTELNIPKLTKSTDTSQQIELNTPKSVVWLRLFLEERESLIISTEFVSAKEKYVFSDRSKNKLNIDLASYLIEAEIAKTIKKNIRFQIKKIGQKLWRDIFDNHPIIGTEYAASTKSDILSLVFIGRDELLGLPLEFLFSRNDYLVLRHPLTRSILGAVPKRPPLSPTDLVSKVHVLLLASNTNPCIPGVDREIKKLQQFFEGQHSVDTTVIRTEQATYDYVRAEIANPKYDIIHYAGHGQFIKESPERSKLYFWSKEQKQGTIKAMSASELKTLLESSKAKLLYLSACDGMATGDGASLLNDDFLGLADAAIKAGVPSVIGYRWPVLDIGAQNLAVKFYESLFKQGNPPVALLNARREVASLNRDDLTWLSPIMIHQA